MASALSVEVQLQQHVLQEALQPVQGHHLRGVQRGFQEPAQALQGLQAPGPGVGTALRGGQQTEEVLEVLQVIRDLHHVSGRQADEDLLVDCQRLVHLGQTQDRVEPGNEVQASDPLLGGYRLLWRGKRRARAQRSGRDADSPKPSACLLRVICLLSCFFSPCLSHLTQALIPRA